MKLRLDFGLAIALSFGAVLSACSSSVDKPYFRTDGVAAPSAYCPINPNSFAKAEKVPDLTEPNGCGLRNAYRITAVSGVSLSQPAVIRCELADTVNEWLANSVQSHAQAIYGQNIVGINVMSTYSCRPRNNIRGAKLSEHGMGNAIDIGSFTLADGREINVKTDWYAGPADNRSFLRAVRQDACGPFHTVLGPGADAEHHDHFHLDLQKERGGGPYCH